MDKSKILIVEDSGITVMHITSILEKRGYDVIGTADTGERAIEAVDDHQPDLIIMDIILKSDMNGIEAAKIIRSKFDIPIIYLTANTDEKNLQRAKETQPYGYTIKPVKEYELYSVIETALYKHSLERKLKESEEKYRSLVENINDILVVMDADGNITYISPVVVRLTHYKGEELIGKNFTELVHPDDLNDLMDSFNRTLEGQIEPSEFRMFDKDGSVRYIRSSSRTIVEDGRVVGLTTLITDIEEQKKLEQEKEDILCNLQNRMKELNCLYSITEIVSEPGITLDSIFKRVIRTIPDAWQYPEITQVRIILNGREFRPKNFRITPWILSSDINTHGKKSGTVEVYYTEERPEGDEGPFSKEERSLIDTIAEQLGGIAERKYAEDAIRESEERFNAMSSAAQDAIIMIDNDGKVNYCNNAVSNIFGYSIEEISGKELHTILAPQRYYEAFKKGFSRFRATGEGAAVGKPLELTALTKSGSEIPVELSLSSFKMEGKWCAIGIVRDITERKRVEEELMIAQREVENLLSSIASILIKVSTKDKILYWNKIAEKTFGIDASGVMNRLISECGIDWEWEKIYEGISHCIIKDIPVRLDEIRFKRIDGKEGFIGITVNPMKDENGNLSGFLLFGSDITNKKLLESQLLQAQKLESIGQLAAGIAHEINTPTQYVSDNTYFIRDSFTDLYGLNKKYAKLLDSIRRDEPFNDILKDIDTTRSDIDIDYLIEEIPRAIDQSIEGLDRITRIVKSMKQFSHPGTEQKVNQDINKTLEDTITISKNEWKYFADIETEFDKSLPPIPCYPADLNQVFLNIIVNAAHAIEEATDKGKEEKGVIRINTRRLNNHAEIRISDNGKGIPADIKSRVFDPFFTTKAVGKGTGQGLAISHSIIVEKHGGSISVDSEVGKGAVFIIRLPIEDDVGRFTDL